MGLVLFTDDLDEGIKCTLRKFMNGIVELDYDLLKCGRALQIWIWADWIDGWR